MKKMFFTAFHSHSKEAKPGKEETRKQQRTLKETKKQGEETTKERGIKKIKQLDIAVVINKNKYKDIRRRNKQRKK